MLADAFRALEKLDWGADLSVLQPIEDATIAADPNAAQELENRFIAILNGSPSRDAHGYICRKLAIIGTAAAVPALAAQLGDKDRSHMARYALERINCPEAGAALRDAIGRVNGTVKIGVIGSLGSRRDSAAVAPLSKLLAIDDPAVARAAAMALGRIGDAEAAAALKSALPAAPNGDRSYLIDALLGCAEALLAIGKGASAEAIYRSLLADQHPRLVRLAATRGLLACMQKQG